MIYFGHEFDDMNPNSRAHLVLIVLWLLVILAGIVLKLAGVLDASWWVVLMPLWAPVLALLFIFGILIYSVIQFERAGRFEREDYDR